MSVTHDHFVVPFVGRIEEGGNTQQVADQLQALIDHYAQYGWEFYSMEKVGFTIKPGCVGALLGHGPTYANVDQVVFRRPR